MTRERRYLLVLAAVVVAWLAAWLALWPQTATGTGPRPGSAHSRASLPADFSPTQVVARSDSHWWVLGRRAGCYRDGCRSWLLSTTNAGRSFELLPPLPFRGYVGLGPVIADPSLLFASNGHGRLWVSADGGRTWRSVRLGGWPSTVAQADATANRRYLLAVVSVGGHSRLERAPLRTRAGAAVGGIIGRWTRLPTPAGSIAGIMVQGSQVLLLAQPRSPGAQRLYVSHDAGADFRPTGAKLQVVYCGFSSPAQSVIWAGCSTGMMMGIWRSTDGGRSFRAAGSDAFFGHNTATRPIFAGTSGAAFAPVSATTALLGLDPVYRTTDGGSHYHPIAGTPAHVGGWPELVFTDPGHGLAIGAFYARSGAGINRLYRVTDDGTRFQRIPLRVR